MIQTFSFKTNNHNYNTLLTKTHLKEQKPTTQSKLKKKKLEQVIQILYNIYKNVPTAKKQIEIVLLLKGFATYSFLFLIIK